MGTALKMALTSIVLEYRISSFQSSNPDGSQVRKRNYYSRDSRFHPMHHAVIYTSEADPCGGWGGGGGGGGGGHR